jgi:hypothetical protein
LARLLDPRQEVVAFVGRDDELAALVARCEDDAAGRLRLVSGPGGVRPIVKPGKITCKGAQRHT